MANSEDITVVRGELKASREALAALQRNFDDFQDSSRELEEELEAELGRTQDQVSELTNRLAEVAGRLGDQQAKTRALSSEILVAQAEIARLRAAAGRAATEKAGLEQSTDELEEKCRAALAAEEDARHKLDLAIEEKIFVSNDLEDLRAETLRTEQVLRSDMEDLQQELGRLNNINSVGKTPSLALPAEVSAMLRAEGEGGGDQDLGLLSVDRDPEAADELIKALEEEVEVLTATLQQTEAANDEINLELQELQEQLLNSNGRSVSGDSAGGVLGGEGGGDATGSNGHSSPNYVAEAALKEELSEAMAMCEELDQTVTDLTDELHTKDQERGTLETRLAELEGELGSKTQSLEDQVSKAKTSASTLAAKLSDATAELRAANDRHGDASSKVEAAREREELLREEMANLRERVSEVSSARSDLSNEAVTREAQLEEALSTVEQLRAEVHRLQQCVETLTARLDEEGAARRLSQQAALEREDSLRGELAAEREAKTVAPSTAATATTTTTAAATATTTIATAGISAVGAGAGAGGASAGVPNMETNEVVAVVAAAGEREEGEGGGERAGVSDEGGQGEGQSSGEPAVGGGAVRGARQEQQEAGAGERELVAEVGRLRVALEEARKAGAVREAGVGVGGEAGAFVASALESDDVDAVKTELRTVVELYGKERDTNAALLSKISALRGNIEVICRIRPPTSDEASAGVPIALEALGEGEVGVRTAKDGARPGANGNTGASWRSFTLDKALGPSTSQEEVFRQVEPLALSAADGMNACIFAYGQTGSGKTHTMIGDAKGGEMAGVSYRTMNKLFEVLERRRRQEPDYTFTVKVAMLEIYNEEVRDLLSSSDPSSTAGVSMGGDTGGGDGGGKLEIRRDQDRMVQVPGLTHVTVSSAEEVLTLLERGGGARAVAATGVHDHSSRSHSVLLAEVSSRAGPDALPTTGRLFLVDLAGSERIKVSGVTGAGLREATSINSSLSALGDVMQALDQKQKHVPYRNSKLTFLLQDALGGNSRTAMVVTVCPTVLNVDETLFALQFAARARNVSLGPAHRNVGAKNLLEEGKELRARLREAGRKKEHAEAALSTLQREHARSQQKMGALLESRAKNVGDLRHQLEEQIESLKTQLADSQANVLTERNKRASLQSEAEDCQRQLKRSQAKVTALGRDREEREVKLHAKQEEIAELKGELRKAVSDAKNQMRRLSAGRRGSVEGGYGFKQSGVGDMNEVAPGKGTPHTPSKKLSEAKHRYTRMRQNTPGSLVAGSPSPFPMFTSMPPPPAGLSTNSAFSNGDPFGIMSAPRDVGVPPDVSSSGGSTCAEQTAPSMRAGSGFGFGSDPPGAIAVGLANGNCARGASAGDGAGKVGVTVSDGSGDRDCDRDGCDGGDDKAVTATEAVVTAERDSSVTVTAETLGARDNLPLQRSSSGGDVKAITREGGGGGGGGGGGAADDVAAAIARATAGFARPTSRGAWREADGGGGDGGERRVSSLVKPRSGGGVSASLMRGTASSASRLRLSNTSTSEDTGSGSETPRTAGRRSGGVFGSTASSANKVLPPSPSGRVQLTRPSSFSSSLKPSITAGGAPGTRSRGLSLKTPASRARNSVCGPVGGAAAAAAAAAAASVGSATAPGGGASRRRTTMQPSSPALTLDGHSHGHGVTTAPASSRSAVHGSSSGGGGSKGWLGEKSRGGGNGGVGGTAASEGTGGQGDKALSRAQMALNRHQARMDRIREKREERMGGKDPPAG